MIKSTKEQIQTLIELQNTENKLVKINSILGIADEKIAAIKKKETDFLQNLKEKELELEEIEKEYEEVKHTSYLNEERIKKSSENIKHIQTNKEYQTLLREIDENKKKQSHYDDEIIKLLENIEIFSKETEELKKDSMQISEKTIAEIEKIKNEFEKEQKATKRFTNKRNRIRKKIDANILKKFNMILKKKEGIAIAPAEDFICKGCYMNIQPQIYVELQKDDIIHYCSHCFRMIYFLPPPPKKTNK